jgi:hypothetical protein
MWLGWRGRAGRGLPRLEPGAGAPDPVPRGEQGLAVAVGDDAADADRVPGLLIIHRNTPPSELGAGDGGGQGPS